MGKLHANHLSPEYTERFRHMIRWLRVKADLSWNQIIREAKLERVLASSSLRGRANSAQALKDMSESRTVPEAVFMKVADLYTAKRKVGRTKETTTNAEDRVTTQEEKQEQRILEFLQSQNGKPVANASLRQGVKGGSTTKNTRALQRLIDRGEVEVVEGPWPLKRGQVTSFSLTHKEKPAAEEPAVEEQPAAEEPAQQHTGATLDHVRENLDHAIQMLKDISKREIPNLPASAQDVVKDEYDNLIEKIVKIRQHI